MQNILRLGVHDDFLAVNVHIAVGGAGCGLGASETPASFSPSASVIRRLPASAATKSAGFLPLVSVGLHQALTPIHAMLNDPDGATKGINYLLPILMMAGGGQVGAGLALYFKTKNAKLKKYVAESIPVGILGVGEPLMYAVTLPLVRPFVTACLGAGFGGALAALLHIGTVSQGVSGLFGLLIVVPGQQLGYVAAMLLAYAAGFVLTWFFGVDEQKINEFFGE